MAAKTKSTAIPQEDIMELVHELDTYQIELELQNKDLRNAQIELDQSRRRFSDLYDFAPVAYLTLSNNGKIIEANLTAADMLGLSRGSMLEQRFTNFIFPEDQDIFYRSQKKMLATKTKQTFELRLRHEQGALFHAQLIAAVLVTRQHGNYLPACNLQFYCLCKKIPAIVFHWLQKNPGWNYLGRWIAMLQSNETHCFRFPGQSRLQTYKKVL